MYLSIFRRAIVEHPGHAVPAHDHSNCRSDVTQRLIRLLLGTCVLLASTLALAQSAQKPPRTNPATNLTDTWQINGNGWPGQLVINQNFIGGGIQGTMYGDRIVGYFASVEGTAVIVRYSQLNIPMQAFVGTVSPDGARWTGKFYGLDVGPSGATEAQNVFGFTATRGTTSMPAAPPSPSFGPGTSPVDVAYNITGNTYSGSLNFRSGSSSSPNFGQLDGTVYGEPLMGTYAIGANTLAFLRLSNGQPAQVFLGGSVGGYLSTCRLEGFFYPLTEGMGADPARLTYSWTASVPGNICN